MANQRKFAYRDASEDEYIMNCLENYPAWAKESLSPRELQIFKSHTTMRQFINNATSDQKKLILAKANIRFVSLYLDMNKEVPLNLKNFTRLYRSMSVAKERRRIIEEIHAGNTFATSSRETLNMAYLLAQNCHTPYWFINKNYQRTVRAMENMKNLGSHADAPFTQITKDADKDRDICANFFLASLRSDAYAKVQLKLDMLDVRILMHLFIHRDQFVEQRVIKEMVYDYKSTSVATKLFQLVQDGYADINRSNARNKSYTIAELGIITVNELLMRLTQKAVIL